MNFLLGKVAPGPRACSLKSLQGVDDDYELLKGLSRSAGWPDDAFFAMSESFPENILVDDFVLNTNGVLVVSEKVRALVERLALKNVEFLPVALVNHKGRTHKAPYFILNLLELQDCIDLEKSVAVVNPIDPERFLFVKQLVLDESRLDPGAGLFRMKRYAAVPVLRQTLAGQFQSAGLSGIEFVALSECARL